MYLKGYQFEEHTSQKKLGLNFFTSTIMQFVYIIWLFSPFTHAPELDLDIYPAFTVPRMIMFCHLSYSLYRWCGVE